MIPQLIKIRQSYQPDKIADVESAVYNEIKKSDITIKKGASIAVAVGSRGISNIETIVKRTIDSIVELGGSPFIVPSMGSHGGATAEGQIEILESLGISEETVGAPIRSSMDVVEIPSKDHTNRIFMDKYAFESDGVVLINRIKPHSSFHGDIESGIAKMCVVGLGKHAQALEIHSFGIAGMKDFIPTTAKKILDTGKIVLGIGIVENAKDETMIIQALRPSQILEEEAKLLNIAKQNMPSLPIEDIDILITDKCGKNISGTGLDPNIIGKIKITGVEEPKSPRIKYIIIDDLTDETKGNAVGMGFADVITQKLHKKVNFNATYENVITSTFFERVKVPLVASNIKRAYEIVRKALATTPQGQERIVRISDTLHITEMYVSKPILDEIKESVEIISDFQDTFDESGELKNY